MSKAQPARPLTAPWAPPLWQDPARQTRQELRWGDIHQSRLGPGDVMFTNTGRRIYVIGDVDGGYRPRTNPYDLHSFGGPLPTDPLANELQGVWVQPTKALDGFVYSVEVNGQRHDLLDAECFTQTFADVTFEYQLGSLAATRRDFAAQDAPVLFTALTLRNNGDTPQAIRLTFSAFFDLKDAWFVHPTGGRNRGQALTVEGERLLARALRAPDRWAVAVGGDQPPQSISLVGDAVGQLAYTATLAPGVEHLWTFAVAAEHERGAQAALDNLDHFLPRRQALLAEKRQLYERVAVQGPRFHCPDPALTAAFAVALANMQLLEAESPALGRYFYAGLENFPFWFSNDGAYSAAGLLAAGHGDAVKQHQRIGQVLADAGRVPHQASPAGHVVGPGNAQETPQWVMALWDVYRWTGDRAFLAETYAAACQGLFDATLGVLDPDGDGYPAGPGMVEREDMGAEKVDSAAYCWAALRSLSRIAEVLDDKATASRAASLADGIAARFDDDWWDAESGLYAVSLDDPGNARRQVFHWAVITPLEVGLATPEHAAATLATLRHEGFLNRWGLKHTTGQDERVWTLPTALLSRSAYRYGQPDLGFEMLQKLAEPLQHGSIGMFHELIPDGLCFVQLWSAAVLVRGVIEDLMGVEVDAGSHAITVAPRLPSGWEFAELQDLRFGDHCITIRVKP